MFTVSACTPHTTGLTEVGVRTCKIAFWGAKGVEDRIYAPGGTYFFLPFINDWHVFDTKLQNLEMTFSESRGDRRMRDDLVFKTIDGNDIGLDVIIVYRIDANKAPHILQYVAQNDDILKGTIVRTVARSKPRDIFGELKTEAFYVAEARETQSNKAREALQDILGPMGIIVEKVLTNDYRFNAKYTKAIEEKKVAGRLSFLHLVYLRQCIRKYHVFEHCQYHHVTECDHINKLKRINPHNMLPKRNISVNLRKPGEVNKMVANADGEYLKAKIEADVYQEQQKLLAQAIQAEGIAEANGIMEMNKALEAKGGEVIVKLRIAEALQGKRIILLPVSEGGMNLKTTDINGLIDTLGIKSLSDKK